MGTLMEEVSYEDDPDMAELEETGSGDQENRELSHLRHQNRRLEEQLRSNEESNERLSDDLESLRREHNLLRTKSEKKQDEEKQNLRLLRERNAFLEDLYARTKIKYRSLKKSYKALQRESLLNLTSFDQDLESTQDYVDTEQSFSLITEEDDQCASSETICRLQKDFNESLKEKHSLNEKLSQETRLKKDLFSKFEETESLLQVLKVDLNIKENLLKEFKTETNNKIDEAIQYIKLIENEFNLDSVFPNDVKWTLEEKLDLFPTFIKNIYRYFVNLEFSTKRADVKIRLKSSEAKKAPLSHEDTQISDGSQKLPPEEKIDPSLKADTNANGNVDELLCGENTEPSHSDSHETPSQIFKQRKFGFRGGLMRAVSHDPTRIKEWMLFHFFSSENENVFSINGTLTFEL